MELTKIRIDGGTQPRDAITPEVVAEYTESLQGGAEFPPVTVFHDGSEYWLADGFHRLAAHRLAKREDIAVDVRQGTRREAILYSVGANADHGLRRTNADKRRAVMALLNDDEWSQWSDREIARRCAVSDRFVNKLRPSVTANGSQSEPRTYTTKHGTTATMDTSNIGKRDTVDVEGFDEDEPVNMAVYGTEDDLIRAGREALQQEYEMELNRNAPHVSHNSGENEWYTPKRFIDAARATMGSIDCDPASSDMANETVKAGTYFTAENDGLLQQWHGNVWMNPPYAQPLVKHFCEAVVDKYKSGEINQACVLVNNATETAFFQYMLKSVSAICFPRGRVQFIDKNGSPSGAPLQGQAVVYFGNNVKRFATSFEDTGVVLYG